MAIGHSGTIWHTSGADAAGSWHPGTGTATTNLSDSSIWRISGTALWLWISICHWQSVLSHSHMGMGGDSIGNRMAVGHERRLASSYSYSWRGRWNSLDRSTSAIKAVSKPTVGHSGLAGMPRTSPIGCMRSSIGRWRIRMRLDNGNTSNRTRCWWAIARTIGEVSVRLVVPLLSRGHHSISSGSRSITLSCSRGPLKISKKWLRKLVY